MARRGGRGRGSRARGRPARGVRGGAARGRRGRGASQATPRGRGRGRSRGAGRGRAPTRGLDVEEARVDEQVEARGLEEASALGRVTNPLAEGYRPASALGRVTPPLNRVTGFSGFNQGSELTMRGTERGRPRGAGRGRAPTQGLDAEEARVDGQVDGQPARGLEDQQREVRGLEEGEGEDITGRIRPAIPPADPEAGRGEEVDGWGAIGRVGAWGAMLAEGRLLEAVPEQHKSVWVWAAAEVLRRLHEARTEEETSLALMWWCFLPQALLRKPPNRGGRAARGEVAKRFNTLGQERNWGKIVELWEVDRGRERRRREGRPKPREEGEEEKMARLRREVVGLINQGKISKALQRVTSCGVASVEDPAVLAMLQSKYPARGKPLPARVTKGQCVDGLAGLRESLLKLEPGVSAGTGGMKAEYLITLAERLEDQGMDLLEEFGMKYLRGDLPPWFYPVWLTVQTVPLFKSDKQDTLRPVGVRNPLLKLWHRQVVVQNKQELKRYLEPQQIACTEAGAGKLVMSVRSLIELRRSFVVVKLDLTNAFNENSRSAVIEALEAEPTLKHLAWFAATVLAPYSGLETGGRRWGETGEGRTQGAPESAPLFCVAIQPAVRRMDARCREAGGMAKFGMDDGYAVGPKDVVFDAVRKFAEEVREQCLLQLEWSKTEVFSWDGVLPEGCPPGITLAGEEVEGVFQPGFLCYGVPVGSPEYATSQLMSRANKIAQDARRTVEVLGGERQSLWAALKWSISQRFDYWCQLSYPSDLQPAASWLDGQLWSVLESAVGVHIPRGEEGRGWECVPEVPIRGREGRSFASWLVRLPIKLGGMGSRSLEETSKAAFVGAVEQAVPSFSGPEGMCPQLDGFLGGEESFGEGGGGGGGGGGGEVAAHAGVWREAGDGVPGCLGEYAAGGAGVGPVAGGGAGGRAAGGAGRQRRARVGDGRDKEGGHGAAGAAEAPGAEEGPAGAQRPGRPALLELGGQGQTDNSLVAHPHWDQQCRVLRGGSNPALPPLPGLLCKDW